MSTLQSYSGHARPTSKLGVGHEGGSKRGFDGVAPQSSALEVAQFLQSGIDHVQAVLHHHGRDLLQETTADHVKGSAGPTLSRPPEDVVRAQQVVPHECLHRPYTRLRAVHTMVEVYELPIDGRLFEERAYDGLEL